MEGLTPIKINKVIGSIEDNLDEVEAKIKEKVEEYKNTIVTEDAIKDVKKFLAEIRKEKNVLDTERKEIKKAWMEPFNQFEARAKKIIALYDDPIGAIKNQIDAFEEKRKEEKRIEIKEIYESIENDIGDFASLCDLYDKKWENASVTKKQIKDEIEDKINKIKCDISIIKSFNSEFEESCLEILKETGDVQAAIQEMQKRNEIKKQITEQNNKKEEEKKEENNKKVLENCSNLPFEFEEEKIVKVFVRKSELDKFLGFLDQKYIRYEVQ